MEMLLSRQEAARELRVGLSTLDRMLDRGELRRLTNGRRVLVSRQSLEEWVQRQERAARTAGA